MAVAVQAEVLIERPAADVASFAMSSNTEPALIAGSAYSQMPSEPPLVKGGWIEPVAKLLGRRVRYVTEVTEHRYKFAHEDGATRVRIRVQGGEPGFFTLAEPLLGLAVSRSVAREPETLRGVLESNLGRP